MKLLSALAQNQMKAFFIWFPLSLGLSVSVWADEGPTVKDVLSLADELAITDVMSVAKMTGACSIVKQQLQFQAGTGMPGGGEFLKRFWTMEAARLGMTPDEHRIACFQSADNYNALLAAFTGQ